MTVFNLVDSTKWSGTQPEVHIYLSVCQKNYTCN